MSAAVVAIQAALDDSGKVVKKQRSCETQVEKSLAQLIDAVASARAEVASEDCLDPDNVIKELRQKIDSQALISDMISQTKDLHTAVGKLSKVRGLRNANPSSLRRALMRGVRAGDEAFFG